MPEVMGYYNTTPTVPTVNVAAPRAYTATAASAGQTPIATSDTWVPTSFSDPYVAGLRTSAASMAAVTGTKAVSTMARWNSLLSARSVAARGSASAARAAGRRVGTMSKMTKQMAAAKSVGAKAQLTKGVNAGVGTAFKSMFSLGNIARSLGSSALIAVPMSLITNFLDWKCGKINDQQRNSLIIADAVGYTVTGASASLIGGAVGSTVLGPGFGTVIGIAAGFGLGWVYEKFIRPTWGQMVTSAMYGGAPAAASVSTPNFEVK